ncbi:hypothetical protein ACFOD4_12820 [Pseudoroseomonas globiformis]|uniref:Glycosyltransferase n=1 Tax=Teichococcus globiformis TaxID=2307229 RepID=A0ABV7FZU1_9PROT
MAGPRILVVSPIPSHPADQGNSARIQALGHQLKQRGAVADFFYYGMEGLSEGQRATMSAFWNRFHFMPSQALAKQRFATCWGLDDWCPAELVEAVRKVFVAGRYDAVVVNYVWMSRILEGIEGAVRILDTHDLFGDRHLISQRTGLEPRWFFTSATEEDRGFARADIVIGIQDAESAIIRRRFGGTVLTVGYPMAPRFLTDDLPAEPPLMFGYLGSGNPWNVRSIGALDTALALEGQHAEGRMDWAIAGTILRRNPDYASRPMRLGVLPTVDQFYQKVRCVLNPMLGGTGLKIKTVEALAYGRATIGTEDAFVGLPARHPAHRLTDMAGMVAVMRDYQRSVALRQELLDASMGLYLDYLAHVGGEYDQLVKACGGDFRDAA